jgi:PAS domain S-box-containing protein
MPTPGSPSDPPSSDRPSDRQSHASLVESEERIRSFVALTRDAVWCFEVDEAIDPEAPVEEQIGRLMEARLAYCNQAYASFRGADSPEELLGMRFADVTRASPETNARAFGEGARSGHYLAETELELVRHDGARRIVSTTAFGVRDAEGMLVRLWGRGTDVTDRLRAEEERERLELQLQRAQRLESVGALAGGVAHDFNNLLTAILGAAELASADPDEVAESMETIREAALRARELTRQLLSFARHEPIERRTVDLRDLVARLGPILRRILPSRIDLVMHTVGDPALVVGDPSQLEQIVMNLAINARDAIASEGRIDVGVGHATLVPHDPVVALSGIEAGPVIRLSVSDSGTGMAPEVLERAFDPFFTTKAEGVGTGLGLSIVHGTVRRHGGWIRVESAPGFGTTFLIDLPVPDPSTIAPAAPAPSAPIERPEPGRRTVLVAEDEPLILSLFERVLEREGYRVLSAGSGKKAIELLAAEAGPIDAVISDVVMAGVSGIDVFHAARARLPNVPVLLCSGYTAGLVPDAVLEQPRCRLLHKPFRAETLLRTLDELILAS